MATATASRTKIRPLDDRVLVRPEEAEGVTASGIYLPEGAKEKIPFDELVLNGGALFAPPADFGEVSPAGFVGRADLATAEKGEREFELAVDWICRVIRRDFLVSRS